MLELDARLYDTYDVSINSRANANFSDAFDPESKTVIFFSF